jgi:hypothetical protein
MAFAVASHLPLIDARSEGQRVGCPRVVADDGHLLTANLGRQIGLYGIACMAAKIPRNLLDFGEALF